MIWGRKVRKGTISLKRGWTKPLANQAWFDQIGQKRVEVFNAGRFDHFSLYLCFNKQSHNGKRIRPLFRIEDSWTTKVEGEQIVREAWLPNPLVRNEEHNLSH